VNGKRDESNVNFKLINRLALVIGQQCSVRLLANVAEWGWFKRYFSLAWCDLLIVHSHIGLSFDLLLLSRLLRKRVVGFVWDEYPVVIDGERVSGTINSKLMNFLNDFFLERLDRVVIPSRDFKLRAQSRTRVLPLWPWQQMDDRRSLNVREGLPPIKIAFVGQINIVRALDAAIRHILEIFDQEVELHLFSNHQIETPEGASVFCHRYLDAEHLRVKLMDMDYGLVCLNEKLESAAFPSKSLEYLSLQLPILYYGPSLPGFVSLFEKYGVCIDITNVKSFRAEDHVFSTEAFTAAYSRIELTWADLENIL
jgi:hypothetical protein